MRGVCPIAVLALGLSLFVGLGCGEDDSNGGEGEPLLTEGVFGRVSNVAGAPLPDTTVEVRGVSTTTDGNGDFAVETSSGAATVTFRRDGFLPALRSVVVDDDSPTATRVVLIERAAPMAINADTGGMATGSRGAAVMIQPGALADPAGASVSGMVDVSLTPLDPSIADELQGVTGCFEGRSGSEVSLLESFGILDVTIMQDATELEVMPGESLEIRIPAPGGVASNMLPATMPLWSLDPGTGQWVEEGTTTLDEASNTYVADIPHMSVWNADQPTESTCITGVVIDEDGDPLEGAGVDSVGLDYFGFSQTTTVDDGRFYLVVRKNSEVSVAAYHAAEGFDERSIESGGADTDVPATVGDSRCLDVGTWQVMRATVPLPGRVGSPSRGEQACGFVDADMVTAAFEGTASEGVPQDDASCEFELTDGGVVREVDVFFFGDDSGWESVRGGFEDFRGGTTDVAGVGDEAFYPNDSGPTNLVFRARGFIFEVVARIELGPSDMLPPTVAEDVAELARAIAGDS